MPKVSNLLKFLCGKMTLFSKAFLREMQRGKKLTKLFYHKNSANISLLFLRFDSHKVFFKFLLYLF